MAKEEVELLPSGLISCFVNNNEVRIIKISPEKFTIRLAEKNHDLRSVKVSFYKFKEYGYKEIELENFQILSEEESEFCFNYTIEVKDEQFAKDVRDTFKNYTKYIMLKNFGDEGEFSEAMTGYPAHKDYDFYEYYDDQKKDWMRDIEYLEDIDEKFELALKIDNFVLYDEYLKRNFASFKDYYYEKNNIKNDGIFKRNISRIYIGNEFCHNLFPKEAVLIEMLKKAAEEKLDVTLCFTYLREDYIDKNRKIIDLIYDYCKAYDKKIEVVINDWGTLEIIKDKRDYITPVLGVLLNKRKKDPRYNYKNGYEIEKERISENSLNSSMYREFLESKFINRYEYESSGYKIKIAEGNHSLQIPFYVTNVSQYCPLNAVCKTGSRGKQKLVKCCPKYCKDYVFMYPKHLKMVGRYNSLFSFDDTILKDKEKLKYYTANGIDRIVLNFI